MKIARRVSRLATVRFFSGCSYAVNDNLVIDVAYSYLKEESVKVNDSKPALGSYYSSKYENSANGFAVGATYKF